MFPILLVGYLLELRGKGFLALMPTVALLLAIEAAPVLEFANLGSLTEAYEEPVVIPCLEGVQGVSQWHGICLGHRLGWVGVQLSRMDSISVIPFLGRRMSVVTLRWFQRWLVLDDVDGGYRVRIKASFSSCSNRAFNKSKGVVWGWSFRCTTMGRFLGRSPT